jgi:hypothetical protein
LAQAQVAMDMKDQVEPSNAARIDADNLKMEDEVDEVDDPSPIPLVDEDEPADGAFEGLMDRLASAGLIQGERWISAWSKAQSRAARLWVVLAVLEEWLQNSRADKSNRLDAESIARTWGINNVKNSSFHLDNFMLLAGGHQPALTSYLRNGFENGFDILFEPSDEHRDVQFANPEPENEAAAEALRKGVAEDVAKGYVAAVPASMRQFKPVESAPAIVAPVKVVPKKRYGKRTGKWRRVHDLSKASKRGASTNDGIDRRLVKMRYTTVWRAAEMIRQLKSKAAQDQKLYLSQIDLTDAYRILPVRPDQWQLLGFELEGRLYVETRVSFGLASAPRMFSALSGMCDWLLRKVLQLDDTQNYLDDWLLTNLGDECSTLATRIALTMFRLLGIPVNMQKLVDTALHVAFLGIEIDTEMMTLGMAPERLNALGELIEEWLTAETKTKRELQSLAGSLIFVSTVIRPGRLFTQRLFAMLRLMEHKNLWIVPRSSELRRDLSWWKSFLPVFEIKHLGVTKMLSVETMPVFELWTDASDFGGGAHFGQEWFQLVWTDSLAVLSKDREIIFIRELFTLVAAALTWGHLWADSQVLFHCDNANSVVAVKSGKSRNAQALHLLRVLHFHAATHNYEYRVQYVSSEDNKLADALSRNDVSEFMNLLPSANRRPTAPRLPPWQHKDQWEDLVSSQLSSALMQSGQSCAPRK